jgi:2-polyprenyl-3-methyl-5-hydroxy-6-metoxy-1,4-benzoquinol methylase
MRQQTCPFCGGKPDAIVGIKENSRILRCGACALQFAEHAADARDLSSMYDEYYFNGSPAGYPAYEHDEPIHRARAREYLKDLAHHVPRPGHLMDVGCATGYFLDEARAAGWNVRGWEVSEWAAEHARQRFGLDVTVGSFPEAGDVTRCVDVVTFLNVFEQLPNPRAAERALRRMVRPGGIVALEAWDADAAVVRLLGMGWHKYRPRYTPIYLNRRSLETLFSPAHWRVVEFRPRTKWISLAHGLHVLGVRRRTDVGGRAPREPFFLDLRVPYRLGDLVWIVVERRGDNP